ncbi:unnamed protein product, partial [Durusdinium trenchii]
TECFFEFVKNINKPSNMVRRCLPSSYGRAAVLDSLLAIFASAAAVAGALRAGRPGFKGLDLVAGASTLYILIMYCFQSSFLEWPEPGFQKPQAFLTASLGNLLLPNLLAMKGFWAPPTRLLSITFSCGLAFQAYQQLVKGPSYRPPKLQDRVFFVTGANSGIGFEASKAFALAGATVVFGCRDQKRATTAMRALVTEGVSEAQLHFLPLDLTSLQSVRRCAQLLEESGLKVDVLVLNAGVMRRCRELTEDGFEMTMAANHLGHFLLVQLLVPHLLAQEAQGRHPRVGACREGLVLKRTWAILDREEPTPLVRKGRLDGDPLETLWLGFPRFILNLLHWSQMFAPDENFVPRCFGTKPSFISMNLAQWIEHCCTILVLQ